VVMEQIGALAGMWRSLTTDAKLCIKPDGMITCIPSWGDAAAGNLYKMMTTEDGKIVRKSIRQGLTTAALSLVQIGQNLVIDPVTSETGRLVWKAQLAEMADLCETWVNIPAQDWSSQVVQVTGSLRPQGLCLTCRRLSGSTLASLSIADPDKTTWLEVRRLLAGPLHPMLSKSKIKFVASCSGSLLTTEHDERSVSDLLQLSQAPVEEEH